MTKREFLPTISMQNQADKELELIKKIQINPDDGKQPKNVWVKHFNFLALYIEYILQSKHYGHKSGDH